MTAAGTAPGGRDEVLRSPAWDGTDASVAVVVSTFRRSGFLRELVAAVEAQDLAPGELELVLVDNGSGDDTWAVLADLVARTPLAMAAVRLPENHGPAPGRNAGVRHARAPLVAITDDDCIPTPGWLRGIRDAFARDDAVEVVQGTVRADPAAVAAMGPWDHTIWVTPPTPFFETCNVAYRRRAFERAGGFDEDDPLLHPPSGRAFGEDACLAWEVQRTGGRAAYAPDAVVHHRCLPGTYRRWLADQRQLARFPGLARRSPLVADWLTWGVFLSPRSALFDVAVAGTATAAVLRSPWPLLAAAPWLRMRWGNARHQAGSVRRAPGVLARLAWSDVVALGAMAAGSVRYRRLVL